MAGTPGWAGRVGWHAGLGCAGLGWKVGEAGPGWLARRAGLHAGPGWAGLAGLGWAARRAGLTPGWAPSSCTP